VVGTIKTMATIKQKKAIDNLVGNGGNVTKAMLDAGYSPNTANTPQKFTQSVAYAELLEAYLPDDMLLRALSNDIEGKELNRKAELELAFKLKGKMVEKSEVNATVDVGVITAEEKTALLSLLNGNKK